MQSSENLAIESNEPKMTKENVIDLLCSMFQATKVNPEKEKSCQKQHK
jgi:hypothetical protein